MPGYKIIGSLHHPTRTPTRNYPWMRTDYSQTVWTILSFVLGVPFPENQKDDKCALYILARPDDISSRTLAFDALNYGI